VLDYIIERLEDPDKEVGVKPMVSWPWLDKK